jgi:hypothetical protein
MTASEKEQFTSKRRRSRTRELTYSPAERNKSMALKDDIESCKIVNRQMGEGLLGPATCSAPVRRYEFTLKAGADTRESLADLLDHIAGEMINNPGISGSTIGGCSYGGHYEIRDRGAHITPETFKADLDAWMKRGRGQNTKLTHGSRADDARLPENRERG